MLLVSSIEELKQAGLSKVSIACGNFDGVHLGHQKIISRLLQASEESSSSPVVLSFSPHPREVLTGQKLPHLASLKTKLRLLSGLGVEALINLHFTKDFASMSALDFVNEVLQAKGIEVCNLCVGSDWRFGAGRQGDVSFLREGIWGFRVLAVEEEENSKAFISSSRIRAALADNSFVHAKELLGRDYSVSGVVIKGQGIAHSKLKFPTANIDVQEQFLPLAGVFACRVAINGEDQLYYAVCNIGSAPTFEDQSNSVKVEAHLLDFTGNLYGLELEIFFIEFLREERKFASIEKLKEQISIDVLKAREIFS